MNDCSGLPGQGHEGQVFKVVAVQIGHQAASQPAGHEYGSQSEELDATAAIPATSTQNQALAPVQ